MGLQQTSRFLMQATQGVNYQTLEQVDAQGVEAWLEQQLNQTWDANDSFYLKTKSLWRGKNGDGGFKKLLLDQYGENAINGNDNNPALPYKYYFRMAWWHRTLAKGSARVNLTEDAITGDAPMSAKESDGLDLLRHKVAQALSEILVISDNSVLELNAEAFAGYYDLLYKHAFGSYRDLLSEVSLHPCMGVYLTHINNRKADAAKNIHPDENYAREIMQLFTIGLYELNSDGSQKLDGQGQPIASYDNDDIRELARVFTGIKSAHYSYEWPNTRLGDDFLFSTIQGRAIDLDDNVSKNYKRLPYTDMLQAMVADGQFHDDGHKTLLNGRLNLAAGQRADDEIREAVRQLVAHPNTAPFVAKKLIQFMVTSNPTSAYVQAVAEKFGSDGDLKATVREILLYPLSNVVTQESNGAIGNVEKLKSPMQRIVQLLRAFNAHNQTDRLWVLGDDLQQALNQHPMSSPTVFNFYKPDFAPQGAIQMQNKVAPEFELENSYSAISFANTLYDGLFGDALPLISTQIAVSNPPTIVPQYDHQVLLNDAQNKMQLDFSEEMALAADVSKHDELIERISVLLTGKTDLAIKANIKTAVFNLDYALDLSDEKVQAWVVQTIVYLVAISPEFSVLGA